MVWDGWVCCCPSKFVVGSWRTGRWKRQPLTTGYISLRQVLHMLELVFAAHSLSHDLCFRIWFQDSEVLDCALGCISVVIFPPMTGIRELPENEPEHSWKGTEVRMPGFPYCVLVSMMSRML